VESNVPAAVVLWARHQHHRTLHNVGYSALSNSRLRMSARPGEERHFIPLHVAGGTDHRLAPNGFELPAYSAVLLLPRIRHNESPVASRLALRRSVALDAAFCVDAYLPFGLGSEMRPRLQSGINEGVEMTVMKAPTGFPPYGPHPELPYIFCGS